MGWKLLETDPGSRALPDPVLGISVLNKRLDGFVALIYGAVLSYGAVMFVEVFLGCIHGIRAILCETAETTAAANAAATATGGSAVGLWTALGCALLYGLTMAYMAADFAGMIKTTALFPYYSPGRYHLDLVIPVVFLLLFDAARHGSYLFIFEFALLMVISGLWGRRLEGDVAEIEPEQLPTDHLRSDLVTALNLAKPEMKRAFHGAGAATGRTIAFTHFIGAGLFGLIWALFVAASYLLEAYLRPLLLGRKILDLTLSGDASGSISFTAKVHEAVCGKMGVVQLFGVAAAMVGWYVFFIRRMVESVGRPNDLFLPVFVPKSIKRLAAARIPR